MQGRLRISFAGRKVEMLRRLRPRNLLFWKVSVRFGMIKKKGTCAKVAIITVFLPDQF